MGPCCKVHLPAAVRFCHYRGTVPQVAPLSFASPLPIGPQHIIGCHRGGLPLRGFPRSRLRHSIRPGSLRHASFCLTSSPPGRSLRKSTQWHSVAALLIHGQHAFPVRGAEMLASRIKNSAASAVVAPFLTVCGSSVFGHTIGTAFRAADIVATSANGGLAGRL